MPDNGNHRNGHAVRLRDYIYSPPPPQKPPPRSQYAWRRPLTPEMVSIIDWMAAWGASFEVACCLVGIPACQGLKFLEENERFRRKVRRYPVPVREPTWDDIAIAKKFRERF